MSSQGAQLLSLSRKLCGPRTHRCPGSIPEARDLTNGETEAQEGSRMVCWGVTGGVPRWAALTLLVPGESGSQMSVQQWLWLCSQAQRYLLPWWGQWRHRRGIERAAPARLRAGAAWGESPEPLGDCGGQQNRDRRTCPFERRAPSCCWGPGGEHGSGGSASGPGGQVTQLARKRSQARSQPWAWCSAPARGLQGPGGSWRSRPLTGVSTCLASHRLRFPKPGQVAPVPVGQTEHQAHRG